MTIHPRIHSFSLGLPKEIRKNDHPFVTGIRKTPVQSGFLFHNGFRGDDVGNKKSHGGPDRAVCFYPYEHYEQWEREYHIHLHPPAFGENLTVIGMLEKDVAIGNVYKIEDVIIQVSQGRVPCKTIDRNLHVDSLLKRFIETRYTGFFGRVLQEGRIYHDSKITLLEQHPEAHTVWECSDVYFKRQDKTAIKKLLELDVLSKEWKERYRNLL